jgi:hypothetical protein
LVQLPRLLLLLGCFGCFSRRDFADRLLRRSLGGGSLTGISLGLQLLDAGVDQADQVAHRRADQADDRHQRRGDRAEHLAAQHLDRRQGREVLDVGLADRVAVEDATADRQDPRRPRRVGERLRHTDHVAVRLDEGDRRRALQHG